MYEDGSENFIPLTYCGNISHWKRRHSEPFVHGYYRHNGYQAVSYETDGVETKENGYKTLYRYEWINPKPDKTIEKIQYVANETAKTDVYVSQISVIK